MSQISEDETDIFKILIATDNHLGYGENNPILDNDSFNTFEEILQIGVREQVDFILLGGDLFHNARPSPYTIHKCTELIKRYCLGDKIIDMEFLSDPSVNFSHLINPQVNYEDPNMNIAIPIFSIHGNHDDPTGKKQVSAMDLMSSMGLINYFGRWDDLTKVHINPILLKKGQSKLALYGLSHIRDERLARLFHDNKVTMETPPDSDDWFNMLILHQNRANRGVKNFICESFIPEFIDLVMWGHEHDCLIEPTLSTASSAYIIQPGSSVATSLSESEALTKHVGILKVNGKNFHLSPIELRTCRPFIYKQIQLDPPAPGQLKVKHDEVTIKQVEGIVKNLIVEAGNLGRIGNLIPLIRLIVKFEDEKQVFNAIRFGQRYVDKVANPNDMIKFVNLKKKERLPRRRMNKDGGDDDDDDDIFEDVTRVEDLIEQNLGDNKLMLLSLKGLTDAVKKCVDSGNREALPYLVSYQEKKSLEKITELRLLSDEIDDELERLRMARENEDFSTIFNAAPRVVSVDNNASSTSIGTPTARGRGRGRGGARGRGRAKAT